MAKAGAKTRVIANAKRLKLLKIVIMTGNVRHLLLHDMEILSFALLKLPLAVCILLPIILFIGCKRYPILWFLSPPVFGLQVFHVAAKFILFKQVSNLQSWLGLGLTSLIYMVCFSGLAKMAGGHRVLNSRRHAAIDTFMA
jgi:hypothetical protein